LRVLHVTRPQPDGEIGGADTHLLGLVRAQRESGLDVHVSLFGNAAFARRLAELGVRVHHRPEDNQLKWFRQLLRVHDRHRPHVVHSHGYKGDYVAAYLSAARRATPFVATAHGLVHNTWRLRAFTAWNILALNLADHVLVTSRRESGRLRRLGIREITFVPNGLDTADFRFRRRSTSAPDRGPVVVYIGRLSAEKRVDLLVEAVAALTTRPRARLLVVGAGPERAGLEALATRNGMDPREVFAGFEQDVRGHLGEADVLVCPSDTEGTPRCVLEAMAAGCPVVATDVGGVPDMLAGGAGRVVQPGNPDELRKAIQATLEMAPAERDTQVRLARERVERHYSMDSMHASILETYRRVIA
jgi:glycosyltransferase involved in cell wall biosynthesis